MSFVTGIFIYLLIWWVTLFTVLPFGVERHTDEGKGFDAGAPRFANIKKKLIINTIISALILAIIAILVDRGVIDLAQWFRGE